MFSAVGCDVSVARLAMRFVPTVGHGHDDRHDQLGWLDYYYDHKVLLRFSR